MKDQRALTVWSWRLMGLPPLYAALTLAAATLAAPPDNPDDPLGDMHQAFLPLAEALPGADVWPQLMNLNGKLVGAVPVSLAVVAVLLLFGAGALTQARRIAAQIRQDAAVARDEAIRERVRRQGR
jgi:hypothetical protein